MVNLHRYKFRTLAIQTNICFVTNMSHKCIKISSCACFLVFSGVLLVLSVPGTYRIPFGYQGEIKTITFTFSNPEVQCNFRAVDISDYTLKLKAPSLESFIRASTAMEGKELRLSGLAVFSKLVNVCQPLPDVSKAKTQVNKIALISLPNETVCPLQALQGLVVHAQNAGYSGVIFFHDLDPDHYENETQLQHKLVIPVLSVKRYAYSCYFANYSFSERTYTSMTDSHLLAADRTYIDIRVTIVQTDLTEMQQYLRRLYYWFLLAPVITIEWLRRRNKLCRMTDGQQAVGGWIPEDTAFQSALNTAADHQETYNSKEKEQEQTACKIQPLLIISDDTNATKNGHARPIAIRRVLNYLGKILGKLTVGSGYVICVVVALPVGISAGGWSFFRFDQNEIQQKSFWDDLITFHHFLNSDTVLTWLFFYSFLPMWWSPLQIFCFFLYSRFTCKTTWTIATNFSKLIRSDWFASNMYLLVLGVVVPYCTSTHFVPLAGLYFACYNTVCTICNALFVIILDKHKFVTRYVFYISVCMICAYIESSIVAAFYFMLNSKGSLTNLNLTALRTVAIGVTLTLSLSTSMHMIRKLNKPRESLFEGLGEK